MGVFKRGKNYWYEFEFRGQRVRESAHTPNHARRRGKDLIDFITKRVQDAIEKSEFKRMGEKFSQISITRAIAKIGREDENEAAAPAAGID